MISADEDMKKGRTNTLADFQGDPAACGPNKNPQLSMQTRAHKRDTNSPRQAHRQTETVGEMWHRYHTHMAGQCTINRHHWLGGSEASDESSRVPGAPDCASPSSLEDENLRRRAFRMASRSSPPCSQRHTRHTSSSNVPAAHAQTDTKQKSPRQSFSSHTFRIQCCTHLSTGCPLHRSLCSERRRRW